MARVPQVCMGMDELEPLSKNGHKWFGLGLTLVDSLDTMYLMGLMEPFEEATRYACLDMFVGVVVDAYLV